MSYHRPIRSMGGKDTTVHPGHEHRGVPRLVLSMGEQELWLWRGSRLENGKTNGEALMRCCQHEAKAA